MAGVIDISILGDKRLERQLARLAGNVQKKYMRQVLRKAAKDVKNAARKDAPVDTGGLRRGLKVRALKRSRNRIGVKVSFEKSQFYGKFTEWGAPGKGIQKDSFLYPAIDDNRSGLITKVARLLRAKIEGSR